MSISISIIEQALNLKNINQIKKDNYVNILFSKFQED